MLAMRDLLDQIRAASEAGLHYVALWGAFSIPDICGALAAPNGQASGKRYIAWFDANLPDYATMFPGADCYAFRCSMLHQGSGHRARRRAERLIIVEPMANGNVVHRLRSVERGEKAIVLDARTLVRDITDAAERWLDDHRTDPAVQENISRFVHRHPNGLPPHIVGTPVLA